MARYTKTKRPEKKLGVEHDFEQAEQIQSGLETFFHKLVEFKWLALGAVALLVVAIVAISVITEHVRASGISVGADLNAAMVAVKAIDATEGDDARKAAVDKALTGLEPLVAKYASEPAGRTVTMLKASVLLKGGRAAEALPLFEQLAADPKAEALALPVLLGVVEAAKATGDLAASVKALEGAKESTDLLGRLLLAKLLGDLYNPFIGDGKNAVKDREKALHHYNEALALLKDRSSTRSGSTEEFFQNELKKRIAFLKG